MRGMASEIHLYVRCPVNCVSPLPTTRSTSRSAAMSSPITFGPPGQRRMARHRDGQETKIGTIRRDPPWICGGRDDQRTAEKHKVHRRMVRYCPPRAKANSVAYSVNILALTIPSTSTSSTYSPKLSSRSGGSRASGSPKLAKPKSLSPKVKANSVNPHPAPTPRLT